MHANAEQERGVYSVVFEVISPLGTPKTMVERSLSVGAASLSLVCLASAAASD